MSLLKKKNCCCGNTERSESYCAEKIGIITSIKILGAGCASCHKLYETVKEAVKNLGLGIEVEYITDFTKISEYGVMSVPAIVVNDKVVSMGKVLKVAEVEKLLS